jgi:hypothetical protein
MQRQEEPEFEMSLGYIVRLSQAKQKETMNE